MNAAGARPVGDAPSRAGRIGPNAVTRLAEALDAMEGRAARDAVFARAGLPHHLESPPSDMVDDEDVARLHEALVETVGFARAQAIGAESGRLTGDYLLAHRIPRFAQRALRALPRPVAARVLAAAIAKHAWTFAGAGAFAYRFGARLELTIAGGPVSRYVRAEHPACAYYAATFERVFSAMLGPRTGVTEIECEAQGAPACRFVVEWKPRADA